MILASVPNLPNVSNGSNVMVFPVCANGMTLTLGAQAPSVNGLLGATSGEGEDRFRVFLDGNNMVPHFSELEGQLVADREALGLCLI